MFNIRAVLILLITSLAIFSLYLMVQNYQMKSAFENLIKRQEIEQQQRRAILPVCMKGEVNEKCRKLAADETGATVRGARQDEED